MVKIVPALAAGATVVPRGRLEFTLGGFLVRTGDRVILVDTGAGTIDNGQYRGGQLLDSLRACGVTPDDVTDVVFTHPHFDHVGWAAAKGEVVFRNATYRVHEADWAYFVERPAALSECCCSAMSYTPPSSSSSQAGVRLRRGPGGRGGDAPADLHRAAGQPGRRGGRGLP